MPSSVHHVLSSTGAALSTGVRAHFEHGFGHDFSHVRVHDDSAAARSAADVDALAYTVGSHVVFGAGQFSPGSPNGRHLLAHELAHVVQQRGDHLQHQATSALVIGGAGDAAEKEADAAAHLVTVGGTAAGLSPGPQVLQREPRPGQRVVPPAPPGQVHPNEGAHQDKPDTDAAGKDAELKRCMKGTDGIPDACPQPPLAWSDFKADDSIGWPAQVQPELKPKVMDPAAASCVERVLGWSPERTHVFQAVLGKAQARKLTLGMLDDTKNGCGALWSRCQDYFAGAGERSAAPFTVTGRTRTTCPATVTVEGMQAKSFEECSALSKPCHERAELDQARLLRHEQGHMDIACVLARKINASIAAGAQACAFDQTGTDKLNKLTKQYDDETRHGCLPGKQAGWETKIRLGLTDQTVRRGACPTPRPPRPPRGGRPSGRAPGSRPTTMRLP
ncbi:DUF4157 domain-containing protein [Pinirhizobacter sp.]|uniref:eCIS core domain-containing protein n=1 Tax=Pinirhizobacter sp. TaxID=2950432 RepID=UPI002F3F4B8B